jgi:hypothetical protein
MHWPLQGVINTLTGEVNLEFGKLACSSPAVRLQGPGQRGI